MKTCDICHEPIGMFNKFRYADGYICKACYKKASRNYTETITTKKLDELKALCSAKKEIEEDFATLSAALMMLQMDYLGGHGSRGYGRVAFSNFSVRYTGLNKNLEEYAGRLKTALEGSCLK